MSIYAYHAKYIDLTGMCDIGTVVGVVLSEAIGYPQLGQLAAKEEISLPHSGHLIKAIKLY